MSKNVKTVPAISIELYADADREAIIAGISDLQEVERALSDTRRPGFEAAAEYIDHMMRQVAEKNGAVFCARVNERVIGFIACTLEHENNPAETSDSNVYGYISDAYVVPEYRGKGVFAKLNHKVEEYISEFPEVRFIRITALAGNQPAVTAYTKQGYALYEVRMTKDIRKK